jgi:ribonuclease BN (tRNA processing enzyme)
MTTVWVLGSMGWMPSRGQQTACVLVEKDDELIMLDAGTGVCNLGMCADVLARHGRLSVLLSHYHLDHIAGLMYLKRFAAGMHVDVFGPGLPIYKRSTAAYVHDVLQAAVYSSGAEGFAREVVYRDYAGKDFAVGDVRVQVRPQTHSAPSFELRIADELVYATDTCFDAAAWKNVAPAKLLLHECWQTSPDDPRHTSAEALAAGLDRSRFGQIALLHLNPAWTDGQCDKVKRIAHAHGIELAYDGMVFEL